VKKSFFVNSFKRAKEKSNDKFLFIIFFNLKILSEGKVKKIHEKKYWVFFEQSFSSFCYRFSNVFSMIFLLKVTQTDFWLRKYLFLRLYSTAI